MCVDRGPCQPVLRCPKNADGWSFQRNWYYTKPWLEYSPDKDTMYCLLQLSAFSLWRKVQQVCLESGGVKQLVKRAWKNTRACKLRGSLNKHGVMEHFQKVCFKSSCRCIRYSRQGDKRARETKKQRNFDQIDWHHFISRTTGRGSQGWWRLCCKPNPGQIPWICENVRPVR